MRIRTGDTVAIISGKDKGKSGTVLRVLREKDRVIVETVNMRTKHIRRTPQQAGQKIRYEASIHVSNVMLVDPKTKKPTRIRYLIDAKTGNKQRVAVKSGELLGTGPVSVGGAAKAKKGKGAKKEDETQEVVAAKPAEKPATPPKKEAFWKRASKRSADDSDGTVPGESHTEHPTTVQRRTSRESS